MSLQSVVGFTILFSIIGLLWVGNAVADEMLEEMKKQKEDPDPPAGDPRS